MSVALADPLVGVQTPRVEVRPAAADSLGDEAIALAALAGLHLDSWQQHCVRVIASVDSAGRWVSDECAVLVPRQNGKGAITETLELAGLFLWDEQLIIHSAHEFKTSQEAFRRVASYVENTKVLRQRVRTIRRANGEEGIELKSGSRLRFMARSKGAARGFTAARLHPDETFDLSDEQMAAMTPALAAVDNPQIVYTSTPPLPGQSAEVLASLRERALSDDPGSLTLLDFSAASGGDPDDRGRWAQANPALGIRIPVSFLEKQRRRMPVADYEREHLGVWDAKALSSAVDMKLWAQANDFDHSISEASSAVFTVDVSPDSASTAVAVAGLDAEDQLTVEIADYGPGTGWVVDRVAAMTDEVTIDPAGPVNQLKGPLEAAGVVVHLMSSRDCAASAEGLDAGLGDGVVQVRQSPVLDAAALGSRRRSLMDAWAFTRKDSSADICPLVAAANAVWVWRSRGPVDVLDSIW